MNRAVFWDRDGVLNHVMANRPDGEKNASPQKFEHFKLIDGIGEILNAIKEKGYLNIIATKQPDIARNKMSWEELNRMHDFLKQEAPAIDAIYVCPHDDKDNCNCRKPKPGLLLDAQKDYNLDLSKCYMVGDSQSDVEAGQNAGVKTILLKTNYNKEVLAFDYAIKGLEGILKIIK
jgi:histidinol-phosphate phosphatase family protein